MPVFHCKSCQYDLCQECVTKLRGPDVGGGAEPAPIEVTFQFPREESSIISSLKITIGDKEVSSKVMEKV